MSTFLNDKAVLDTNSVTNTNSLFIYLRDNGTQRKVTAKDIQSFLSQEGLSTRVHVSSGPLTAGSMAVTTITFDTASTNPYGMFNPNTPGILTMPFNGMVQATGGAYFLAYHISVVQTVTEGWFLKNGQRFPGCQGTGQRSSFASPSEASQTTAFITAPFSVTSGDVISFQAQTGALSASIIASHELTFVEIIPLKAWTAGAAAGGGGTLTNSPTADLATLNIMAASATISDSAYTWVVWNGADYKLPISDMGKLHNTAVGALGYPTGLSNAQYSFVNTTLYDTASYFATDSSAAIITNDLVEEVRFLFWGNGEVGPALYINSTVVASPHGFQAWGNSYRGSISRYVSDVIAVSSGDRLQIRANTTNFFVSAEHTGWQIIPVRYKK